MATKRTSAAKIEETAPVTENVETETVSAETAPETETETASTDIAIPEGASRAHGAAIKRLNDSNRRLLKLDARAAKAAKEYEETQRLLNERRPGLVADVARAQVDVDYHANREKAVSEALASAQARAAGHPEDAADNAGDAADPIDALDTPDVTEKNGGHVEFA